MKISRKSWHYRLLRWLDYKIMPLSYNKDKKYNYDFFDNEMAPKTLIGYLCLFVIVLVDSVCYFPFVFLYRRIIEPLFKIKYTD